MLTAEENAALTRVGPGTEMGRLLRRYWHPIGPAAEMEDRWTKRVRLMGEDLVLFKDRQGRFGLVAEASSAPARTSRRTASRRTKGSVVRITAGCSMPAAAASISPTNPKEARSKTR